MPRKKSMSILQFVMSNKDVSYIGLSWYNRESGEKTMMSNGSPLHVTLRFLTKSAQNLFVKRSFSDAIKRSRRRGQVRWSITGSWKKTFSENLLLVRICTVSGEPWVYLLRSEPRGRRTGSGQVRIDLVHVPLVQHPKARNALHHLAISEKVHVDQPQHIPQWTCLVIPGQCLLPSFQHRGHEKILIVLIVETYGIRR